jgi:hypothetical protein
VAVATHGSLRYHTTAKDNPFGYKSQILENYEDALQIVKRQIKGSSTLPNIAYYNRS